jgi:alkylated DNA repair dioxygenase AlkB
MFDRGHAQTTLFGSAPIGFDAHFDQLERVQLDADAWIDYAPMWLEGDDTLFDVLVRNSTWDQPVVRMFERDVLTPRLVAQIDPSIDPVIPRLVDVLSARYGIRLDRVSAGWYRDGNDSVAFHGDRIAREREHALVATISLGSPRRFLIRPKVGGESRAYSLGHGDLVVMGGACQRTWEHGVPKSSATHGRIALMFRHAYD